VLDFNFAYNPSCAYDPRWACLLAPTATLLAVEAGEQTPKTRSTYLRRVETAATERALAWLRLDRYRVAARSNWGEAGTPFVLLASMEGGRARNHLGGSRRGGR
jgi:Protein of unknown function (DUF1684)